MKDLTYEQSVEAAKPIKAINDLVLELDVEYLTEALKQMRDNHAMRDSAAILNPNPLIHKEQQDVNAAKLKQLQLMLELAENAKQIIVKEHELIQARGYANELGRLFGS